METAVGNTYTKGEVDTKLGTKADSTTVTEQGTKITQLETAVGNTYTKAEADGKFATSDALNTAKTDLEGKITANTTKITDLSGRMTTAENNITNLKDADVRLESKIDQNANDITGLKNKDTELSGKIDANKAAIDQNKDNITQNKNDITTINGKLTTAEGNITANKNAIDDLKTKVGTVNNGTYLDSSKSVGENLNKLNDGLVQEVANRTAAVEAEKTAREAAIGELAVNGNYIEKDKNVSDNLVNLDNQAKANADAIVETDKRTGGIKRNLEGNQTTIEDKVTVNNSGDVAGVKGLSAETITTTGNASIGGDLKVDGTITTDKMIFGDKAHNNYTEIDQGKVTSKNSVVNGEGQLITSSSIFNAEENKVGFANNTTGDQSFHKQTSDIIMDNVKDRDNSNNRTQTKTETKDIITDKDGNSSTTSQTASKNTTYLKDKDGKNTNSTIDTAKGYDKTIKGENGETSTKQDELNITNTAKDGTITNDAKDIVNTATTMKTTVTGKATESYGELETTVTGQATENFNGGLNTTVTGTENHTVNGKQINTVTKGQENIISGGQTNTITGGQTNTITGGQINNITGDQTTNVTGDISNKAENITNEANTKLTDKVGKNTRVLDSKGITDTVPGADGKGSTFKQRIDAIMGNVKTDAGESEVTQKGDEITSKVGIGEATNSRVTQKKDSLEAAVTDGTNTNASYDTAKASAKVLTGRTKENKLQDNLDSSEKTITSGTYKTSSLQTALDITNTAKDGTIKNDAKVIENIASGKITNISDTMETTVTGKATESYGELETTIEGDQTTTVNGKVTENYKNGQETNVTGDQTTNVSGTQTTNATDINRNASSGMIDKVDNAYGTNTETKVAGKTTTEVTIKGTGEKGEYIRGANEAKDTLTKGALKNSETKTVKATSTEITDGNGNISSTIQDKSNLAGSVTNGTETGVSGIHGNADSTVSIDSSVADKNGNISTVNQKKDSITSTVSDGTNATTISQDKNNVTIASNNGTVAMGGKDIINNETDTITNMAGTSITNQVGNSKATTDVNGTTFTHTEANTALSSKKNLGNGGYKDTTIKGNTITTGQITMDYAEVMKDLGVKGNATIDGKTKTDSLEVTKESTFNGKATFNNGLEVTNGDTKLKNTSVDGTLNVTQNATVGGTLDVTGKATFGDSVEVVKDLSVGGNATITGDVTAKSYKVGNNTYIDANGINANNQKITNVADGAIAAGSTDAVNGGQLFETNRRIDQFDSRINEVGANAAAMANLHPMEFDADSKLNVAVGVGNYRNKTATAMGLFYRPNEDVMFNVSSTIGSSDNMIGGGVSFRLGSGGNKLKNKAFADAAEQNKQLKSQVDTLQAQMDALLSVINPNMSKDFPDVPDNHWAYEAVSRLAGNDIIQGYEDGKYHGERTMTRYEMAVIIYKALQKGAKAEAKLVEEFKPELKAIAAHEKA